MQLGLALLLLGSAAVAAFVPRCAVRWSSSVSCHARMHEYSGETSPLWDSRYIESLHHRISDASETVTGPAEELLHRRTQVWVLIFNVGLPNEGVYTAQDFETGAPVLVAFDRIHEADGFARDLEDEGLADLRPMVWQAEQVRTFCEAVGCQLGMVPFGANVSPPSENEFDDDAYGLDACGDDFGFDDFSVEAFGLGSADSQSHEATQTIPGGGQALAAVRSHLVGSIWLADEV